MLTIQQIKNTVTDYFKDKPVKSVYLFGSYARGEANEKSDVDLLVNYDDNIKKLSLFDIIKFKINLEDLFKINVDLVEDGFVYPTIKPYIDNNKILILSNAK